MSYISTMELDDIARAGLRDLRAVFLGQHDEQTMEKANLALKILRIGSGRYSAETNRMSLAFRVARTLDLPREQMIPLWQQLAGADAAAAAAKAIAAPASGEQKGQVG